MLTRANCAGTDSKIFVDDCMYNWLRLGGLARCVLSQKGDRGQLSGSGPLHHSRGTASVVYW